MQVVSSASCGLPAGKPGEQDGVFVAVAGGRADREAEGVGRAAVAEPEQRDLLAAGQDAGDVGEGAAVSGLDFASWGQLCSAWSSSRKRMELRVDSEMAGMAYCAARRHRAWL
jgi:hypothetical protein